MKKIVGTIIVVDLLILILGNLRSIPNGMWWASMVYMSLITGFLLLLAWAFAHAQVTFIKDVEKIKHQVLEAEGIVCQSEET